MIKNLRDARIKDGVPKIIAKQDWAATISDVMGSLQEKILNFTDESQIYTAIDTIPEAILDILAVNWKVEWYDNDYSVEQKRRVIKAAIKIRRQMGTVASVRDTLESIFRSAKIVEWFENGGDPGTFEVEISSSISQKDYETFTRLIDTTKRASAHLRSIRSVCNVNDEIHIGTVMAENSTAPMKNDRIEEKETYIQETVLVMCAGEICECHENLFVRQLESNTKSCMLSVGSMMECILTAQLYEHEKNKGERVLTTGIRNGSTIETEMLQNLEE